jgi:membrane-bound lytic murein transglycosylase A
MAATEELTVGAPDFALLPIGFDALPGWDEDDHAAALEALARGAAVLDTHPPKTRLSGIDGSAVAGTLAQAGALGPADSLTARRFFEKTFLPHEVRPRTGGAFFTGYYEPVVSGSLVRSAEFKVPLYRVPDDLVEFDQAAPPPGIDPALRFARRTADGMVPYHDRAAIEAGALAGRGLELVFLADPVEAFFIHIQGSARIRLAQGGEMRVTYAAKSGHPYTPIGRVLVERGSLPKGGVTMAAIRGWLAAHAEQAPAVMAANRSFIFFREAPVEDAALGPVGAAKVALTPGRSLAVDRLIHSFHVPVWIDTTLPDGEPLRRLMAAQDTGSAIVGPARGDIFFGAGETAGATAGAMQAGGRFVLLVPRACVP